MSFSSRVKEELARHIGEARHCRIAEIAAIIQMGGHIKFSKEKELLGLGIQTENPAVARKYFTLLKKTFNIKVDVSIRRNKRLKKHRVYHIFIWGKEATLNVLSVTKVWSKDTLSQHINSMSIQTTCCKRAYIRGAFLMSGSLSDPEKTYHLEFVGHSKAYTEDLRELVNGFGMEAKIVARKKYYILYLKEGRQVVDLLNIMEAHVALMELENLRILKEMRNNVNRMVNCETANINKVVKASVRQSRDIRYIVKTVGLETLPEILETIARIRLAHPSATLKEIGEMVTPKVGKSGVNHRFRKINQIVEELKDTREDFND